MIPSNSESANISQHPRCHVPFVFSLLQAGSELFGPALVLNVTWAQRSIVVGVGWLVVGWLDGWMVGWLDGWMGWVGLLVCPRNWWANCKDLG